MKKIAQKKIKEREHKTAITVYQCINMTDSVNA